MITQNAATQSNCDLETAIRKLTAAQRRVMDRLATGQTAGTCAPRTLGPLMRAGLIVPQMREGQLGPFSWTEYFVPIHAHIAWSAVASAEFDALSPEEQAEAEAPDAD